MKRRLACGGLAALFGVLLGCSDSDRERARAEAERAREKAREGAERAKQDARKLGQELQQDAHRFNRDAAQALKGTSTGEAHRKLERAGETAKVESEHAAEKLSQAALIARVKAGLANNVGLSTASSVEVDAAGHVVTLRGTVASEEQKRQAQEVTARLDGVTRVINDLRVQP